MVGVDLMQDWPATPRNCRHFVYVHALGHGWMATPISAEVDADPGIDLKTIITEHCTYAAEDLDAVLELGTVHRCYLSETLPGTVIYMARMVRRSADLPDLRPEVYGRELEPLPGWINLKELA